MISLIIFLLVIIFLILSLIHFHWAVGGTWGFEAALPTRQNGERVLNPRKIDSFIVGAGLAGFAFFYLRMGHFLEFPLPGWIITIGKWLIPSIFLIRAIGDFKYVGFFKKIKTTDFGKNDSTIFSPLCLLIALLGYIFNIL